MFYIKDFLAFKDFLEDLLRIQNSLKMFKAFELLYKTRRFAKAFEILGFP